ncbi:hypothetical protein ZWY2020_024693 [Hordeum vulgare]|nr:hypothetical protein ZWY2020_024693 [Hordeum vulgare]
MEWKTQQRLLVVVGGRAGRGTAGKHLYVVLDDRAKGYSIHKIDVDAGRPLLRLDSLGEASGSRGVLIGSLGSKILALWQPTADGQLTTHTVAPPHPDALLTMPFVVAAGERLYALHDGGMHCLELVLDETLPSGADEAGEHRRAWTRVSSPLRAAAGPRRRYSGRGRRAHAVPIEITSYALRTDGRTIFVSAHATRRGRYAGTFSLDTTDGSLGGDAE